MVFCVNLFFSRLGTTATFWRFHIESFEEKYMDITESPVLENALEINPRSDRGNNGNVSTI